MEGTNIYLNQIGDYLRNTPIQKISYGEITRILREVTASITKPSAITNLTREELLTLTKLILEKRTKVIDITRMTILHEAKEHAKKLINRTYNEIEPKLNPASTDITKFLKKELRSSELQFSFNTFWDVRDRIDLRQKVNDALHETKIPGATRGIEPKEIPVELISILSQQYFLLKRIDYIQMKLNDYNDSLDKPFVSPIALETKIPNWQYAIALALLQQCGALPFTLGKMGKTIEQAKEQFEISERNAKSVYDSITDMVYPDKKQAWDVNYYLSEHTKKRPGYKENVERLLNGNQQAIRLLHNLSD